DRHPRAPQPAAARTRPVAAEPPARRTARHRRADRRRPRETHMSDARVMLAALLAAALAAGAAAWLLRGRRARRERPAPGPHRVLFPFLGRTLSRPALEAALRLARAGGATLVPVYLAEVPLHLPLDTPLPRQSDRALTLLEAVEQRAHQCGIPVDARIERGRDPRHALREMLEHEHYD